MMLTPFAPRPDDPLLRHLLLLLLHLLLCPLPRLKSSLAVGLPRRQIAITHQFLLLVGNLEPNPVPAVT